MSQNTLPNFPAISAPLTQQGQRINEPWLQLLVVLWNSLRAVQQQVSDTQTTLNQTAQDAALIVPPISQMSAS